ncbi:MAG: GMC family oxidoreductase [Acidobacteriaceae bacterium]|nr:GMC family oxidoreductase [Acidobacteriaceae bacterium]MBV9763285.1 GMC family oxidoreductase [Acidobacteriaceae bacterium]
MQNVNYDVCVIGSGAAGGVMAKELCEGGAKVLLIEAGEAVSPGEFRTHCWPYEMRFRGLRGEKQEPFYPPDMKDTIRYETSEQVSVDRVRVLGGRTVHWNAVVLRYAPSDFRERTLNGIEEDWPLSYEELAPYYDRIEKMIGVCGNNDNLEVLPAGPWYLPPPAFRCSEQILKKAIAPLGIPVIAARKALLTRPYDNRPPCHYCGHCMEGCDVSAIFSTPSSMLPKAKKTGNLTLRQNAVAREILVDTDGSARALSIVDRATKKEEEVRARIFVVCCSTVETARLLLNSRSPRHPAGLANSSGVVGRYLHGHLGDTIHVYLKELEGRSPENLDGALDHAFVPRYRTKTPAGTFDFQVNYAGYMFPFHAKFLPGYGANFKKRVREMEPGFLMLGGFGKVEARPENRVLVDSDRKDTYGIPIPVLQFRFSDLDKAVYAEMGKTLDAISSSLNCEVVKRPGERPSGFASHEAGTVRMGTNPKTSALNSFCQSHDVRNLFVTDGSTFTTSSEKNPTLTIMALSLRAADYIKEQRRRGEL